MKDLKELIRATSATIPKGDTVGEGDLVRKSVVKKELKEIQDKTKLLEKLGKYKHTDDLIKDHTVDAAKRLVIEMEFGKTSGDRLRAAETLLNRGLGKPVDRVMNINMEISQYSEKELESNIEDVLKQLGYSGASSGKLLIDDESTERGASQESSPSEGSAGQEQVI